MGHFTGHLHIIIGKNHGISDEDLEYFPESIPMMSIVDTFYAIPSHLISPFCVVKPPIGWINDWKTIFTCSVAYLHYLVDMQFLDYISPLNPHYIPIVSSLYG